MWNLTNMGAKAVWSFIVIFFAGIGPLLGIAYFNKFGDFAKSPQTLEMNVGRSTFVAGGRAKIWFASVEMGPMVEITCKGMSRMVELVDDEPSDEVCGIRVRKLELIEKDFKGHPMLLGKFEVTWDDR